MEILKATRTVLASLAFACAPSHAAEAFAEAGQCRFGLAPDGTYYQSDRYTRNYMTPRCGVFGLADKFRGSAFGWRVGFLWTGSIEARDNIATFFDADAFQPNLPPCDISFGPNRARGCIVTLNGHGETWGFTFSATYEQRLRWLTVTPEAGLFFFHHVFYVQPTHIDCTNCRPIQGSKEADGPFTDPSPLLGLTFKVGAVYFAVRRYWAPKHYNVPFIQGRDAPSLTDHSITQVTSGLVLRF
jgi:hypothetical protein